MFPGLDGALIDSVLEANGYDMEDAIDTLLAIVAQDLALDPLGGDYDSSRGRNGDGGGGSSGTSTSEQQIAEDEEVARQLQQQLLGEEDSTQQQLPQQSARAVPRGSGTFCCPFHNSPKVQTMPHRPLWRCGVQQDQQQRQQRCIQPTPHAYLGTFSLGRGGATPSTHGLNAAPSSSGGSGAKGGGGGSGRNGLLRKDEETTSLANIGGAVYEYSTETARAANDALTGKLMQHRPSLSHPNV